MIDNHGCPFVADTNWTSVKPGLMEDKGTRTMLTDTQGSILNRMIV